MPALYKLIFSLVSFLSVNEIFKNYKSIVTVEDGALKGGFGSAVLEYMADSGYSLPVKRIGIPDNFVEHGTPAELYNMLGMDVEGVMKTLKVVFKNID